jgi:Domain of unknown function (DUF5916)/Carbohydrate family 9 binding domain-like
VGRQSETLSGASNGIIPADMPQRAAAFALLIGLALAAPAAAQPSAEAAAVRRVTAHRADGPIVIDGSLDEPVWREAVPADGFVQVEPREGIPASERTEVRLVYDDQAVYVGVVCFDSDPSGIITSDSRRDSSLSDQDSFQMIFDTYHDRQNGFVFGTNSAGAEYDAQVRNEGQTQPSGPPTLGGTSSGSGSGVNANWDGAWEVKTRVTETGWQAEFRIPLRTLRYGTPPQVWGVNFTRNIQRKREETYWSPVSRIYNLTRVSSAGELVGLNLKTPRNLKLMPYVISSANRNFTPGSTVDGSADWGADAKVGITTALNLDLTYNTDFAQVEVDEQQINLTRFNLLFPEKRPFFLENRGLFAVGKSGQVDLFFSRRIGINDDGTLVPIEGGARLSGKARGLNIGFIDMQTQAVAETPGNNYLATRISKDLPNRSSVGGIFVNRAATGSGASSDDWNRTWGADGKWGVGDAITFSGFAARTQTPGDTGRQGAYDAGVEYNTRARRTFLEYTQVGESFNPEVGFLQREDGFRELWTGYYENVRTPWLRRHGLREWRPHTSYESFWGFDGLQETATWHMDNAWDFESGYTVSPALNIQYEGLREPFEVYPGVVVPPGRYVSPYAFGIANTDRRKWISGGLNWSIGGFLSGSQVSLAPSLNLRQGGRITSSLKWTRNDITLPQGAFTTNLITLRGAYNFTPLMNAQALVQYNDRTRRWSTNLRFNLQESAATGLYIVYNDTEAFDGLGPVNRAFVVKYSHLFDVLH